MKTKKTMMAGMGFLLLVFFAGTAFAAPGKPTLGTPNKQDGELCSYTRTPTFNWSEVGEAKSYKLKIYEAGKLGRTVINQWVGNVTSWAPSNYQLTPGKTYHWKVMAKNRYGQKGSWSNKESFVAGKLKYMSIHATAFRNRDPGDTCSFSGHGMALIPEFDSCQQWVAPVNLPDGALIDGVIFCFWNNGEVFRGSYVNFCRSRYPLITEVVASVNGSTNADSIGSLTGVPNPEYAIINNSAHSYYLNVCLPSVNNRLRRVIIKYWD